MITWISQDKLDYYIDLLLSRISDAMLNAQTRRKRNVVDPFFSLVIASTMSIADSKKLQEFQLVESVLRGASNALGEFHQNVLGSVEGWENHDSGYDLECRERQIIAEVKNKHNTMNAPNRREVVDDLRTALRQKKGSWLAYLALVVPKKPVRYSKLLDKNLIETDGASFYGLVTGQQNAIHQLLDYMLATTSPSEDIARYCLSVLQASLPPRI